MEGNDFEQLEVELKKVVITAAWKNYCLLLIAGPKLLTGHCSTNLFEKLTA